LAIYRPVVESTATSFELTVPRLEEFAATIQKVNRGWKVPVEVGPELCANIRLDYEHSKGMPSDDFIDEADGLMADFWLQTS
jgi:hypothetical protein